MNIKENKKLHFYIKYINFICYGLSIFFFLFVFFCAYSISLKEKAFLNKINSMLDYCNSVNSTISNNLDNNQNNTINNTLDSSTQLFFDAKSAIITAFNNIIDANSFSALATGKINLSAPAKLHATLQMDIQIERYNKTKIYEETLANVVDSNLPSLITKKFKTACKRIKDGTDNAFVGISKNIKFEGTQIKADYSDGEFFINSQEKFFNDHFYIINEETIQEECYLKVKKENGKIKNYYVQVILDNVKSVEKYKKVIAHQVNCKEPKFTSITLTAIIDAQGNLVSFSSNDYFSLNISGFSCKANSNLTFYITNINKPNNFVYTDL